MRQPLICSGHSRPVSDLSYSNLSSDGCFIVSACLGMNDDECKH